MRAILQRVTQASVKVEGRVVGAIDHGVLILLGVTHDDTPAQADWLAAKIAGLRIFRAADGASHFDRSLREVAGAALVVSQFTLYGEARKGRRPDFTRAAKPDVAEPLIDYFCEQLRRQGVRVETGVFGADMAVALVNDGPVTLILDAPA